MVLRIATCPSAHFECETYWTLVTSPLQIKVLCFLVPFVIPLPIMGLGLFAGRERVKNIEKVKIS